MSRLGKICFIFAGLSFAIFGIAKYMLGVWIPFFWILLGLILFFIGAAVFVDRVFWKHFITLKTTKHGMNMGVLIFLTLSFLILLNYIAVRNNKTWDFSASQNNTLSDQSIQVLKDLDSDLKIVFFYKRGAEGNDENRKAFREIVKKYQDQTDKIKFDFYEVNENRALAEEYGVTKGSGVAFVDYKGKRNRIEKIDEQELTSAIIKVTRTRNKTIYFVSGHQEPNIEDSKDQTGAALYKLLLENNSFTIKTLNLPTQPKVPDDADELIILGPKQDFAAGEIKAIDDYLKGGGQAFIALEAKVPSALEKYLHTLGIIPQNNFIKSSFMGVGYVDGGAIGNDFSVNSPITKNFAGHQEIMRFGWPMDIKTEKPANPGIKIEHLVKTTKDATAFPKPEILNGTYPGGPFSLLVQVSGQFPGGSLDKQFTLIVAGDAEFLSNSMLYQNLNRDVGLGIASALAKEENLINIVPREIDRTEFKYTSISQSLFLFGVIIPIPLLLLGTGVGLWMKRRNA